MLQPSDFKDDTTSGALQENTAIRIALWSVRTQEAFTQTWFKINMVLRCQNCIENCTVFKR